MKGSKNLLVVTGPSNSGKDLLKSQLEALLQKTNLITNIYLITMHTTRPARIGEVYGREYYFDSIEDFHSDKTLTYGMYRSQSGADWYYWVMTEDLDPNPMTLNILFTGMQELVRIKSHLQKHDYDLNLRTVFLHASEMDRLERAIKRSALEPEGIKEAIRRAYADLSDFSPEVLKKIGISENDYIESDTNTLLNMLIRIDDILRNIYKFNMEGEEWNDESGEVGE